MSCVRNILALQREKPNFGNAGSVDVLLNTAKLKMCSRYVCILCNWDNDQALVDKEGLKDLWKGKESISIF